jgi:hypothetical protein
MSSAITLQAVMNWAEPFLKNQETTTSNLEPALTSGNKVFQRLLSAPFSWRWNRGTASFGTSVTTPATVDYVAAIPDFGFMEDAWLVDPSGTSYPIEGRLSLPIDTSAMSVTRPTLIAPQLDDNAGNITWRLKNGPDQAYDVVITYQKKPAILLCTAYTFAPVPDEFAFLFQAGFLKEMSLLVNDSRYPIFAKEFASIILGLQDGLDEQAKAIFLASLDLYAGTAQRAQGMGKLGLESRGI